MTENKWRENLKETTRLITSQAFLVPIQAKVKVGPALYLIRTHGDPSYIPQFLNRGLSG